MSGVKGGFPCSVQPQSKWARHRSSTKRLVLDIFQEKGTGNAFFLATHTFDRGTGGQQIEGHPLTDHGAQEYDLDFRGGSLAQTHPASYRNTLIRGSEAPDHDSRGKDILEEVFPSC